MRSDAAGVEATSQFTQVRLGELFARRAEAGLPGLPVVAVTMNYGLVNRDASERRVETRLEANQHLLVRKGDIVYNMMRMWQGACGLAITDCLVSPAYVVLRPLTGVSPAFAYHLFKSPELIAEFRRHSRGLTEDRLRLYYEEFRSLQVRIPVSHTAQVAIADAADLLDRLIQQTECLIAKLRLISAGLLHDLLSRGLDERGRLRDSETHRDVFIDSQHGRIPQSWISRKLGECLLESPKNGLYKPAGAIGTGTLLVGQTAIGPDRILDYRASRRAVVTPSEQAQFGIKEGDLLLSRVFATIDGVGQPALVPAPPEPAVYESNMLRLRVNQSVIRARLLFHLLQHCRVREQLVRLATSSNQSSINQSQVIQLALPIPRVSEQDAILAAVEAHEIRIRAEEAYLAKLKLQKRGLMNDLLTGRVRV